MEYRRLGKSGLQVSALSLGSWVTFGKQVDTSSAKNIMAHAFDNGINFFDNAEGRITHVGIMLNPQEIIHASGKVRIDNIDSMGIVNSDTELRTHQLRIIKRI